MLTRRFFVKGSALVMAGAGSVPGWLGRAAIAHGLLHRDAAPETMGDAC
jgi:hypothetical protein